MDARINFKVHYWCEHVRRDASHCNRPVRHCDCIVVSGSRRNAMRENVPIQTRDWPLLILAVFATSGPVAQYDLPARWL